MKLNSYVLFQYVLCLIGTGLFLFNQAKFAMPEKAFITIIISIIVVNCGVLFENKKWVIWAEWTRILIYPSILTAITITLGWSPLLHIMSIGYLLISATWFYFATSDVQTQKV